MDTAAAGPRFLSHLIEQDDAQRRNRRSRDAAAHLLAQLPAHELAKHGAAFVCPVQGAGADGSCTMSRITPGQSYAQDTGLLFEIAPGPGETGASFVDGNGRRWSLDDLTARGHVLSPELSAALPDEDSVRFRRQAQAAVEARTTAPPPRALHEKVFSFISRYLVAADIQVLLIALWLEATYCASVFQAFPYLHLVGPKETGKSRALEIMARLAFNARLASHLTPPAFLRIAARTNGAILIDENAEGSREHINVLRAGYRSASLVYRAGRDPYALIGYRAYGPRAFATNLPFADEILASRTIPLHFRSAGRPVPRFNTPAVHAEADALRDELYLNALRIADQVAAYTYNGINLTGVGGRFDELLEPLVAIARVIDANNPSLPSLEAQLREWATQQLDANHSFERDHSDDADFAAGVAAFGRSFKPLEPEGQLGPQLYPGPHLARFLFDHGFTRHLLDLAQLGKRLFGLGLAASSRRIRATQLVSRGGTLKPGQVQCTAYDLNLARAETLAEGGATP